MVPSSVTQIDEDPVQDPTLAWHHAVATKTVASLRWGKGVRADFNMRVCPEEATVMWQVGSTRFIARQPQGMVCGISEAIVVGMTAPWIRDRRRGWQPFDIGGQARPPSLVHTARSDSDPTAALAVVPSYAFIGTFYSRVVWWSLDAIEASLLALEHVDWYLDPIEYDAMLDALVTCCFHTDGTYWPHLGAPS